ncbi:hypothetical protein HispidOSU_011430, partial [Sigmodon hispidus]
SYCCHQQDTDKAQLFMTHLRPKVFGNLRILHGADGAAPGDHSPNSQRYQKLEAHQPESQKIPCGIDRFDKSKLIMLHEVGILNKGWP